MKCKFFNTDDLSASIEAVEMLRLERLEDLIDDMDFNDPLELAAFSQLTDALARSEGIAFTALCIAGRMLNHAWNECFPGRPALQLESEGKTPRIIVEEMLSVLDELDFYDFFKAKSQGKENERPLSARFAAKRFAFKDSNEVKEFDAKLEFANRPFDLHEDIFSRAWNMRQMFDLAILHVSRSEDQKDDLEYILKG